MKALLLGGTGAIGNYLQGELSSRGWDVFVTSRSARRSQGSVTYLRGNAKDPVFLADVLKDGYDVLVDFMTWDPEVFRSVSELMLASAGRYVFLSSYRVFADSPIIDERSPRPSRVMVWADFSYVHTKAVSGFGAL